MPEAAAGWPPGADDQLECVVNLSEGRDGGFVDTLGERCADVLLDVHRDTTHHRSVWTLGGPTDLVEAATRVLAAAAVARFDLGDHRGVHPRFGVVDVVPFVPLGPDGSTSPRPPLGPAVAARDRFAQWAASHLHLPCFLYGPLPGGGFRTLPEVRRWAFTSLTPDVGPPRPHPTAGACAVGARHPLVAYNLTVAGGSMALARQVAAYLRGPDVRALAFDLDGTPQVSINLVEPETVGPAEAYDLVSGRLAAAGARIAGAELVGLLPAGVLATTAASRWAELGLGPERTIEGRLAERLRRR